jgi:5-methylcytosine-specific restriction endonuclease McrA
MSRWFRSYDDALDDPKVQSLPDPLFKAWYNLLCVTSKNDGQPFTADEVAFRLRVKLPRARVIIAELLQRELLDAVGDRYVSHNWDARQYKSDVSSDRVGKYRDKRRANGLQVLSDYSKFRPDLIARDGEQCVYCIATAKLVVDHMVPITLGGTDDPDNLALACKACNSGKAGRTPELAGMAVTIPSAAAALARYRDKLKIVTVTETPPETEQSRTEADAEDARARPPLIRPEALTLADDIALLCGHDLKFLPPAFCGAAMRVESWLAHGWQREMILAAVAGVLAKRSGKAPDSVNYFEKPIAEFIAKAARPLPEVVIDNTPEKIHVRPEANSAVAGADRVLARMQEFDQPAGGGDGSPNNVRLLSKG